MKESRDTPERVDGYWLVLSYPNNPTIRFDARILDRVLAADGQLVCEVGEVSIRLGLVHAETAAGLTRQLGRLTRAAPITSPEVYEDAKQRLAQSGKDGAVRPSVLYFGDDPVRVGDGIVYVGDVAFWLADVEHYALHAWELPLPKGRMQAALVRLVVGDALRSEDTALLARRIAEYEKLRLGERS